jgi:3-methylfumaryl-CoA hydratase
MTVDLEHLKQWLGKNECAHDRITAAPLIALSATLDRDDPPPEPGDPIPALWHWLYFLPAARQSELGPDGHPRRGGFLPPVPLSRRMWAGSRLNFCAPLRVGDHIARHSTITGISLKQGKTGPLIFVQVQHEIRRDDEIALNEEQTIVYRDNPAPGESAAGVEAPSECDWTQEIHPSEVLLFRYSALTFNGHRIHYDRRYATEAEGYPGLVVHAPFTATLLLDLVRRNQPSAAVTRYEFRALRPLFDIDPFFVCGKLEDGGTGVKLWARDAQGTLAMEARAALA